ncbi:MAG: hypothetical protein R3F49_01180 [Planctomycetota bacterium]
MSAPNASVPAPKRHKGRRKAWARRALWGAASVAVFTLGAARAGWVSLATSRSWYSTDVSTLLGASNAAGSASSPGRPVIECTSLVVVVLDEHPVAQRVAASLAASLARSAATAVQVVDAAQSPWLGVLGAGSLPAGPVDVIALVDLVYVDADDWLVDQRCQVRLNVALGRPPRAMHDARDLTRVPREHDGEALGAELRDVLGLDVEFALEYSVDGHWECAGLAASGACFAAAAQEISSGVDELVEVGEWRIVAPPSLAAVPLASPPASPPAREPDATPAPWLMAWPGERQEIYDVRRQDGAREVLSQLLTERDWRRDVAALEERAIHEGWTWLSSTSGVGGRHTSFAVARGDERIEVALAYMQGTVRDAVEQRQVLTLLYRSRPLARHGPR